MLRKIIGTGALSDRIGKAGGWTILDFGSNGLLRLVSNLILTRLLSPEVFGLIALAQVFIAGLNMLSDVGIRASVIRSKRGEDTVFLQTAWTMQILRSALVTIACCMIAWPVATMYDEPVLFPLICVLSLSALIGGFWSISIARANRNLILKNLTILSTVSRVISLVITVSVAWWLQSVWALAFGAIAGTFVHVSLSYVLLPKFDHRFRLEPEAVGEIMKFGRWILLATFFSFLGSRGQQGMFGLIVPVEVIGLIAIATLIAAIPSDLFRALLDTVLFPSFSKIMRERPEDIPRALLKARMFTICLAYPLLFTVSLLGQPIIELLYDDRYAGAGLILSLAALNTAVPLLSTSYQNLLLAEGRSDLHALLMFVWATSATLGIFIGFSMFGLVGSLVGIVAATSLMFFINTIIARRRGYATGSLDAVAYGILVAFYAATLWFSDIPPAFLSPELVGNIMPQS